ncbi:MAG TPA: ABC transporter permease [Chloroflexota bacterium]|nr:ABC transporter permease [Chloroflexota bacterium]
MARYFIQRAAGLLFVLFAVSVITFTLMHAVPGGPWDATAHNPLPEETRRALAHKFGFDQPLPVQYLRYMGSALHLDFGVPFESPGETVTDLIGRTWPITAVLGGITILFSIVVGVPLGAMAALRQNSWIDYLISSISSLGFAVPNFALAIVFITVISDIYHLLPTGGWGTPQQLIMPVIAYALFPTSQIARYTRVSVLEVLRADYIRTARAKGLPRRNVVVRHVLRNALLPMITVIGPLLPDLITGSIFIEGIFSIPGLGSFFSTSAINRDYPMIMAVTLLYTVLIAVTYLVTDLLYMVVDPRVRLAGEGG